jgi:hypothetical protein
VVETTQISSSNTPKFVERQRQQRPQLHQALAELLNLLKFIEL